MRHPSATVRHPYHSLGWTVALAILLGVPGSARAQEQAHDSVQMLQPIVVEAKAAGYSASVISSATKTHTLLRDVPQSVTVITRKLIADQGMQGMADVTRYIPGRDHGARRRQPGPADDPRQQHHRAASSSMACGTTSSISAISTTWSGSKR